MKNVTVSAATAQEVVTAAVSSYNGQKFSIGAYDKAILTASALMFGLSVLPWVGNAPKVTDTSTPVEQTVTQEATPAQEAPVVANQYAAYEAAMTEYLEAMAEQHKGSRYEGDFTFRLEQLPTWGAEVWQPTLEAFKQFEGKNLDYRDIQRGTAEAAHAATGVDTNTVYFAVNAVMFTTNLISLNE